MGVFKRIGMAVTFSTLQRRPVMVQHALKLACAAQDYYKANDIVCQEPGEIGSVPGRIFTAYCQSGALRKYSNHQRTRIWDMAEKILPEIL